MDSIFIKLNYKDGQTIFVLNQPDVFDSILETVPSEIIIKKEIAPTDQVEFIILFGILKTELEKTAKLIAPYLKGDAIFWLAYPKGTSKKYKCDFNRDSSWQMMAPYDLLPVRQIAIDDDWTALRFRKKEYIKNITRK